MKEFKVSDVSDRVIYRLTKYLSILTELMKEREYINSTELSKIMETTAAQVRRDLSTFGEFGVRGKGYGILELVNSLERILGIEKKNNVILVGHGKVGEMISSNVSVLGKSFEIKNIFEKDKSKIGKKIENLNIKIEDISDMESILSKHRNIDLAILAVTRDEAQVMADKLIKLKIKGILNFTTYKLNVPEKIAVIDIDISASLQELNFWKRYNNNFRSD